MFMMLNENSTIAALLGQPDISNHPLLQSLNLAQPHPSQSHNYSHLHRHLAAGAPVLGINPNFDHIATLYARNPQQTVPLHSSPSLPPKLRENERMEFVRQWVNNIPDYASSQGSTGPPPRSPTTSSLYSQAGCYVTNNNNNSSQQPQSVHISSSGAPQQPHELVRQHSSVSYQNRLFSDAEMSSIVQRFREYFESGEIPSLSHVRNVLADSSDLANRKPMSIRSKIKRLQSNGKWRDFL